MGRPNGSDKPAALARDNLPFPQAFTRPGERLSRFLDGAILAVDNATLNNLRRQTAHLQSPGERLEQ